MNTQTTTFQTQASPVRSPALHSVEVAAAQERRYVRRERDFGVGYGRSSGYASDKRYTRDWGNARFRFA